MRVADVKWFEHFIATRVEVGSDPSQNLSMVKAVRIDAEINLLNLKEALKAGK
jgi:hypothetical protein